MMSYKTNGKIKQQNWRLWILQHKLKAKHSVWLIVEKILTLQILYSATLRNEQFLYLLKSVMLIIQVHKLSRLKIKSQPFRKSSRFHSYGFPGLTTTRSSWSWSAAGTSFEFGQGCKWQTRCKGASKFCVYPPPSLFQDPSEHSHPLWEQERE